MVEGGRKKRAGQYFLHTPSSPSRLRPQRLTPDERPCDAPTVGTQVSGFIVVTRERNNVVEGGRKDKRVGADVRTGT